MCLLQTGHLPRLWQSSSSSSTLNTFGFTSFSSFSFFLFKSSQFGLNLLDQKFRTWSLTVSEETLFEFDDNAWLVIVEVALALMTEPLEELSFVFHPGFTTWVPLLPLVFKPPELPVPGDPKLVPPNPNIFPRTPPPFPAA